MTRFGKALLALAAVVLLVGCGNDMSKKDKVSAMIGSMNSPFFVGAFTPDNISQKSGINDGVLPMTYETMISFVFSDSETGIDTKSQVQIVGAKGDGMIPNVFGFVPLSNADKFQTLVKKELNASVQVKDGVSYFRKDKDNYVVAWKDDIAVITNVPVNLENIFSKSTLDSKKAAIGLVNMINGISKSNIDANYRQFLDKEGDIITYANGQSAYDLLSDLRFIRSKHKKEVKALLLGTTFETALTFENGSIKFKGDYFLSDSLKARLDFVSNEGLSADMLNYGRTASPMMSYGLNISADGLVEFMHDNAEVFELEDLETVLEDGQMNLDDIKTAFAGQVLIMMDGFEEMIYVEDTIKVPAVTAIFDLKDDTKVTAFLNQLDSTGQPNGYAEYDETYFMVKDKKLMITNAKSWMEMMVSGETSTIENPAERMTGFPVSLILSESLFANLNEDFGNFDIEAEELTEEIAMVWAIANLTAAETEVVLKNKDKNALRLIVERLVEESERQMNQNNDINALLDDIDAEDVEEIVDEIEEELENVEKELKGALK